VNSLPKTVTRQCRDCDLNPGPSAPESSTLTTPVLRRTVCRQGSAAGHECVLVHVRKSVSILLMGFLRRYVDRRKGVGTGVSKTLAVLTKQRCCGRFEIIMLNIS